QDVRAVRIGFAFQLGNFPRKEPLYHVGRVMLAFMLLTLFSCRNVGGVKHVLLDAFLLLCEEEKEEANDRGKSLALMDGSGRRDRGYGERAWGEARLVVSSKNINASSVPSGET